MNEKIKLHIDLKDFNKINFTFKGIYRFKNKINGKSYIGRSKNIYARLYTYIKIAKNKKSSKKNNHFHNALIKYGIDNFDIYILERLDDNVINPKFKNIESAYIYFFNSVETGYNKKYDDNGLDTMTQDTKDKIRKTLTGVKHSAERIKNQSGYKFSEESKNKMRLAKLGKKHSEEHNKKIGASSLGRKHTEESKQKMRKPKLNKKGINNEQ